MSNSETSKSFTAKLYVRQLGAIGTFSPVQFWVVATSFEQAQELLAQKAYDENYDLFRWPSIQKEIQELPEGDC